MAARGGLNKGRGLGALIPNKLQEAEIEAPDRSSKRTSGNLAGTVNSGSSQLNSAGTSETGENKKTAAGAEKKTDALAGSKMIRITEVVPNQSQPRKVFEEESIHDLAASIQKYGILQPLLVQKKGKYYEIIAGERRWRAAKEAGIKEVPVIIREFKEQDAVAISLIENIQRENLNPIEEARAYERLINEFGLTQNEVANRVSKSRTAVTNIMRLLKLTEEVRKYVTDGALSMGHARALLALEDPEMQKAAADQIIQRGFSVRETEALVKRLMSPAQREKKAQKDPQREIVFRHLEEQMKKKTGTKVSIHQKNGQKGRIEIEYYSDEDLDRIAALIGGGSL